jgi:UrcA family protein
MIMYTTIQMTFRPAALLLCGAMTVCGLAATVRAADDGVPKELVKFADLDISKPAGAKALYGRIAAAANHVCRESGSRDAFNWDTFKERRCVDKAIENAVKAVNAPALSALRSAKVLHLASN